MTISEGELVAFLSGMPKRYLTLVDAQSVYEHVRVCRNMGADDVHCLLKKAGGVLAHLPSGRQALEEVIPRFAATGHSTVKHATFCAFRLA